jgi:sarcosine oxidase
VQYDVIVVGLGVMGASACWQLARRGAKVLGLDAHGLPNTRGSSHGHTRIFRIAYFEHEDYVPLLRRSLAGWLELEEQAQTRLLTLTGGLYIGAPDSDLIRGSMTAARQHSLPFDLHHNLELRELYPQFALGPSMSAFMEANAGYLRAEDSISTLVRLAAEQGADVHSGEACLRWDSAGGGIKIEASNAIYSAAKLILCPGPFGNSILQTDVFQLEPTRQVVGWFAPRSPELATPERLPVWAAELADGSFYYGVPDVEGTGVKLASHRRGPIVDPHQPQPEPTDEERVDLQRLADSWMPSTAGELTNAIACLYENSPDGHFILGAHPAHDNVFMFCGGSGHGFKFAPVVGEVLADLALEGKTKHAIEFLSPLRFAKAGAS